MPNQKNIVPTAVSANVAAGGFTITLNQGESSPSDIVCYATTAVNTPSEIIDITLSATKIANFTEPQFIYFASANTDTNIVLGSIPAVPTVIPTQYSGLKALIDGVVQELCLVSESNAPSKMGGVLKVVKNFGTNMAVYLVETNDPNSSHIEINTSGGVKAIRLKTEV